MHYIAKSIHSRVYTRILDLNLLPELEWQPILNPQGLISCFPTLCRCNRFNSYGFYFPQGLGLFLWEFLTILQEQHRWNQTDVGWWGLVLSLCSSSTQMFPISLRPELCAGHSSSSTENSLHLRNNHCLWVSDLLLTSQSKSESGSQTMTAFTRGNVLMISFIFVKGKKLGWYLLQLLLSVLVSQLHVEDLLFQLTQEPRLRALSFLSFLQLLQQLR